VQLVEHLPLVIEKGKNQCTGKKGLVQSSPWVVQKQLDSANVRLELRILTLVQCL
jgi:hypothetical protein